MKRFLQLSLLAAVLSATLLPSFAGRIPDPAIDTDVALAGQTITYRNVWFRGGQWADIRVSGDFDSDLDLYVYDEFGNLVACDTDYTDQCHVRFFVRNTGRYTIKIVNAGDRADLYDVTTN